MKKYSAPANYFIHCLRIKPRLINLLILAELGITAFRNEINSIKRNIHYEKHIYRTEKLLFRFVMSYPLPSYQKAQNKLWMQFQKEIVKIRKTNMKATA